MEQSISSLANDMKEKDREMVPRILVQAMFALMLASVGIVAYARLTDQPLTGVAPHSEIVREMPITLVGSRNEGVHVIGPDGSEIAYSNRDKAGFVDVIWVSVNRERTVQGITGNPPLTLVRRANGHTAILDPATNWKIELIGYGADNVAAFARLID